MLSVINKNIIQENNSLIKVMLLAILLASYSLIKIFIRIFNETYNIKPIYIFSISNWNE